jgi:mannose-6-phosphate isomerase
MQCLDGGLSSFHQPLRFSSCYQTRVWGGRRLHSLLGRELPDAAGVYGESWELCDRPEVVSTTAEGVSLHELWTQHRAEVFGSAALQHPAPRFPLLMKILDACDDLSLQVHPPERVATQLGGEPKTEMWFIAHAEPGAKLYAGLKPGVTRELFEAALATGTVADEVQVLHPQAGDCLFIPSGRLHAIGAGLMIYEIQQNSDTTYRVHDWNRNGLDGKPRELHVEQSLASIDFTDCAAQLLPRCSSGALVSCEHFDVRLADASQDSAGSPGEHLTLAVTSGSLQVGAMKCRAGDFLLIPASMTASERHIKNASSDAQWLEIRLP